jgi:RNA polymerase sigma-70 factor (ECF subfamily)
VFLRVVENFSRFKGGERHFRNWLYKIATNAVNNHLRKAARRDDLLKRFGKQDADGAVDCESPHGQKLALLRQAVLSLRPRYQTIITLRFFENMKLTEIAEVLGSSDGTVRSQLARALAKLRKKITASRQEI